MVNLQVKTAIILATVLGIGGLGVMRPEVAISQQPPPLLISQSDELAEAERLNQQVEELYNQGKYNEAIPLAERMLAIHRIPSEDYPMSYYILRLISKN